MVLLVIWVIIELAHRQKYVILSDALVEQRQSIHFNVKKTDVLFDLVSKRWIFLFEVLSFFFHSYCFIIFYYYL